MGKRLSQLNPVEQTSQKDYLLVDGDEYLESKKIKLKDIKLENFNTENFYNKEQINGNFIKKEKNKTLSTNDFTDDDKKKLDNAQEKLISGENIKTINGKPILGSGDLQIGEVQSGLIKIVDELPEIGLENIFYLVPKLTGRVEGYGDDNQPLTFNGLSKCSITTTDLIHPMASVYILTSDGREHITRGFADGGWHPLYECIIEGDVLSVTNTGVNYAEEFYDYGVTTSEVAEGSLITGVKTVHEEGGNNYVVTWENTNSNNLFDVYIWSREKWEYLGAMGIEVDLSDYATKDYVDQEIAAFDFIKVVNVLPEQGLVNRIYFVPKKSDDLRQENDLFDEYIWMNIGTEANPVYDWEWITTKQLEIDLTNYVQKEQGKGLSTNDFTNAYKTKLDSIVTNDTPKTIDGEETSAMVSVQDVSPVEHDVKVSVASKNILDANTIFAQQEVTELVTGDNSFSGRGKVGSWAYNWDAGQFMFPRINATYLKSDGLDLKAGTTYTVSFNASIQEVGVYGNKIQVLVYSLNDSGTNTTVIHQMDGLTITLDANNRYSSNFIAPKDTKYGLCFRINNNLMTISNIQIEQASDDTPFTPYMADTSTVGVKRYGKNLFNPTNYPKFNSYGITIEYLPNEDCFLLNGTFTGTTSNTYRLKLDYILGNIGDKYSISAHYVNGGINIPSGYARGYFGVAESLEDTTPTNWLDTLNMNMEVNNQAQKTMALTQQYISHFWFVISTGVSFDNYKVKIQLEKNSTATDYEPFKQPVDVVNGTIKSTSPSITLISDNAGAIITAKYNKDINKTINMTPSNNENRQIATIGDIKNYIDTSILGGAW